jgi:hypothetical protein
MRRTKEQKRDEAEIRTVVYEERSIKEQLALIKKRPGSSKKESTRLVHKMQDKEFGSIFKESKPKPTKKKVKGKNEYSYAVFKKEDVARLGSVIFYGQASPVDSGLSRYDAKGARDYWNRRVK